MLLAVVLRYAAPRPGSTFLDLTLGGGSYAEALLSRGATVIGIDRDPEAVSGCQARLSSYGPAFSAHQAGFASFGSVLDALGLETVDGIVMDLGLSSLQLDDPARGFAFRLDGPLDLRFDRSRGLPAWQHLAAADAPTIEGWLSTYGEVRRARRIARAMVTAAAAGELRTTAELRDLVSTFTPGPNQSGELARVFQALRILVNEELEQLDAVLAEAPERLSVGGRLVVVSYHSLEDRRVKQMLRHESGREQGSRHLPAPEVRPARLRILTNKPIVPDEDELARNPRARSARLRAGERIA